MRKQANNYPIRDDNSILEGVSEQYFKKYLPAAWIREKPQADFGVDMNVTLVVNNEVIGLNFSVQLKAKNDCKGKFDVSLKKSTLNYLFGRLEPVMLVLYDDASKRAYWKWLIRHDFDLSELKASYLIKFDKEQRIELVDWENVQSYVQRIFKVQQNLLTSLEYDLFNASSEVEVKAWAHYYKRNYSEAIFHFRRLVANECKPILLLALAQCEYENFEYDKALHSINLALELDQSENIRLTKACILSEAGRRQGDFYKVKAAEKIFSELYLQSPNVVNCYNLANTLQNLREFERAQRLFEETIMQDRNHAEAWKNLGQLHFDRANYKAALDCYETALRINPDLIQAIVSKAIVLGVGFKKPKNALVMLNKVMLLRTSIFTEYPKIFYWLSFFYTQTGNLQSALLWINRGLDHEPGDIHLRKQKSHVYIHFMISHAEIIDDAIDFFKENELLDQSDVNNCYYLCKAYILKGESELAKERLSEWYKNTMPYSKETLLDHFKKYDIEQLLLPITNWGLVNKYIETHRLSDLAEILLQHGFINSHRFLIEFQFNRILFVASLLNATKRHKNIQQLIKQKNVLLTKFLSGFTGDSLGVMIAADKEKDLNAFSEQFAQLLSMLAYIITDEIARCIGIVIGIAFPNDESVIKAMMNKSNLPNTFLRLTKELYMFFELPMGE